MHIIKPDNLGLFLRTLPREGGFALAISAYACFPLTENGPRELLFETDMWGKLSKALGENDIFDPGFPKPRAEFLLYGRCFPRQETTGATTGETTGDVTGDVTGMDVGVRVGALYKRLQIMGERHWHGERCSAPARLRPVRLDWSQTYGGPEYEKNPLGKGHRTDKKIKDLPAPSLLRPNVLLADPDKAHEPVSFTAIPPFWPQRTKFLSAFDEVWQHEDWPYLPRDSKAEFFCTAQPDQRLEGFFQGTESVAISGAHPQRQLIRSTLPGLRARLFALTMQSERSRFSEITNMADTLWLLPEQEIGILCFRGVLQGVDEDAADVAHVLAAWEPLDSEPRPESHYRQLLQEALQAPEAEAAPPEPAPEPEPKPAPEPAPQPKPAAPPAALQKMIGEVEAVAKKLLAKHGLTESDVEHHLAQQMPPVAAISSTQELQQSVAELEAQVRQILSARGLKAADVERLLAEKAYKPPSSQQLLADLDKSLASGNLAPEKKQGLTDLKQALQTLGGLPPVREPKTPAPEAAAAGQPPASPAAEAPGAAAPEPSATEKQLIGADFHGQVLQGADFSNAVLENADFSDAVLQGADFSGAILTNADFSNADLSDARLNDANANGAKFIQAQLIGTDLRHGQFSRCDFTQAFFYRASLDFADLSNANLLQSQLHYSRAERTSLQQANLTDVNFYGSWLKRTAFGGAVMHHATFSECLADGAEFYEVNGTGVTIRRSSLINSRADAKTRLQKASLSHVNLTKARWGGANLKAARFWNVLMDGGDLSKAQLVDTAIIRLRAKKANFAKTRFENANLRRINIFRCSLRKAKIINTRVNLVNMFGADMYGAHIVDARAHNFNQKRTLWDKANKNA